MASISVAGDSSGSITIAAPAVAGSGTLTLPVATDTLAGIAATQTLTNKTLGAGTVFPAGAVLQVVSATYSVSTTNSTGTYADTGLTATITPTSASSKILVIVDQAGLQANTTSNGIDLILLRGATSLIKFASLYSYVPINTPMGASCNYLDSPATTSATTYKTQFLRNSGAGTVFTQANTPTSTIVLMEIQG